MSKSEKTLLYPSEFFKALWHKIEIVENVDDIRF